MFHIHSQTTENDNKLKKIQKVDIGKVFTILAAIIATYYALTSGQVETVESLQSTITAIPEKIQPAALGFFGGGGVEGAVNIINLCEYGRLSYGTCKYGESTAVP